MDEKTLALRIARFRERKGVSAREMSLAIGQNAGYINGIETGKTSPSLAGIFYICEYLNITPAVLFAEENESPAKLHAITEDMKRLSDRQLETVAALVRELATRG